MDSLIENLHARLLKAPLRTVILINQSITQGMEYSQFLQPCISVLAKRISLVGSMEIVEYFNDISLDVMVALLKSSHMNLLKIGDINDMIKKYLLINFL